MFARLPRLPATAAIGVLLGLIAAAGEGLGRAAPEVLLPALWLYAGAGGLLGLLLQLAPGPWRSWRGVPAVAAILAVALALVATLAGLRPAPRAAPPRGAADLVLVTLDTTRADRWQALATLDPGLEAGAARFTQARSTSGLTAPAHASLFTGRMPSAVGVTNNGQVLPPVPSIPALVRAAGWRTVAAPSVLHLDPAFGFARGFDAFAGVEDGLAAGLRPLQGFLLGRLLLRCLGAGRAVRSGSATVAAALSLWKTAGTERPRFLWVHLFEPHWPYRPPPAARGRAGLAPPWPEVPLPGFDPQEVRRWRREYDGEILETRRLLQGLLAGLERDRKPDRPLWVVVTADHGEALGEHGSADHGDLLYDEDLRVPLLVRGPGVVPGSLPPAVSHLDLLPSLCELLGVATPEGLPGRSWAPALRGGVLAPRPVLAESRHGGADNAMALLGGIKTVRTLRMDSRTPGHKPGRAWRSPPATPLAWQQETEIYDLRSDPHELRPLGKLPPGSDPREALAGLLRRRGPPPPEPSPALRPEVREALEALGYR